MVHLLMGVAMCGPFASWREYAWSFLSVLSYVVPLLVGVDTRGPSLEGVVLHGPFASGRGYTWSIC